jgi:hypothetical protein
VAIVVRLDQERLPWAADGETLELTRDAAGAWQLWVTTFILCLRDEATSVHYHSWRGADAFSYVVAGTRHALEPPPPEFAEHMAAAWRERIPRGWWQRLRRAVCPGAAEACEVCTTAGGMAYDWYLVCWSLPGAVGIDLYLLSLCGRLAEHHEAEPGAAPDPAN